MYYSRISTKMDYKTIREKMEGPVGYLVESDRELVDTLELLLKTMKPQEIEAIKGIPEFIVPLQEGHYLLRLKKRVVEI